MVAGANTVCAGAIPVTRLARLTTGPVEEFGECAGFEPTTEFGVAREVGESDADGDVRLGTPTGTSGKPIARHTRRNHSSSIPAAAATATQCCPHRGILVRTTSLPRMLEGGRVENPRLRDAVPLVRHLPDGRLRVVAMVALGVAVVLLLLGAGWAVEQVAYSGEVLPGVKIEGARIEGKSERDAADEIARLATGLESTPLQTRAGDHTFTLEPAAVGLHIDAEKTARDAVRSGRDGNLLARVSGTAMRRLRADEVPLIVSYDDGRLDDVLALWSAQVDEGIVEGALEFDGTSVVVVEPRGGTGIQRDEAKARIVDALSQTARPQQIELPVGEVRPKVDRAQVDAAAARARALLASNVEIRAATARAVLSPAQLASMLGTKITKSGLDLTLDEAALRAAVGSNLAAYEKAPVDATFAITEQNTVSVVPSQDGRTLDFGAAAADILRGDRVVTATAHKLHPEHDTAWAKKLGIKRQVSAFTTYHPSGQPRVQNIHLAADVLNNTIVEPGQVFSLNETLGPRTPEKGYVKAPILVADGFGEDYGGGVSQLTTTVYNAVFFGGYADVEHAPHRFYISRYPMGREATINYPSVDLKFRNDTRYGVLIRAYYSDTEITVAFFGDNEGRVVREENREIIKEEPVTDKLVTCPAKNADDDPAGDCLTLPALQRELVETGTPGYDVAFDRVIEQPGQPLRRQRYQVHYPMLPNTVLVGTIEPSTSTTTKGAKPPAKRPSTTTTTKPRSR
jgi:vancomycin resistance protein YoaR